MYYTPALSHTIRLFILSCMLIFSAVSSANPTAIAAIQTPHVVPSPPEIAGNAYLLIDFDSGRILAEKDADKRVEPASLTKIMTGYVVINELNNGNMSMDDMVTISQKAWKMPGSKMFIEVGKQVAVRDLIKGMVIQSGNDASVALAEHIAGSEEVFAQLMNKYAKSLGMTNTHYVNATGLPHEEHYTSAHDLVLLTKALIKNFPEEYSWYSEKKFTFNGITQYNRNKLLWQDETVDGLKTGHTESAGYCLVSSAKRDDMRLISVVLGTNSANTRVQETQKLLNYGFRFFETHKMYNAFQRLKDVTVWEGNRDLIGLGLAEDLYVTVPRGQYNNLKLDTLVANAIKAPIGEGSEIGQLKVTLGDKEVASRPLIALDSVQEGSFFKKLIDQVKMTFQSLWDKSA
ncbi:D-Ala-D-Ala carboxypeptidase [Thiosulfatimonas sediminis]|uniref:serine-type D-Ala-D-Ala carboxypeptidase n=1 Tax=Thiosulfatimonas sediminis TaxID=2675054 RepID=A0A6F8PTQ3_9GAMM|nr:D-alanyl-D-alanine carboxypeptidase family protein [Thiosulfatimonas sediminis]BBP45388.1 D-Ala-D-Ala carboxypeptidase [Thiosulfatimonas sediminis]